MTRILGSLLLLALSGPVLAQWLTLPTPGIPRASDGTPDLSAPTPRAADGRPDLTGLWRPGRVSSGLGDRENLQPWVRTIIDEHERTFFTQNPRFRCLPAGPENMTSRGNSWGLRRFLQHPTMITMNYNDGTYREIFMDGRELEPDPLRTWMGYSVGRWDGDTLVVESNGYNEKTWLGPGITHTDQLHIVERYERMDLGNMRIEVVYEDPGALEGPVRAEIDMVLAVDEAMLETVCTEAYGGEQAGWTSQVQERDETGVDLAPEILERYVGTYAGMYLRNHITMEVTLDDGELFFQKNGAARQPLIPQSETSFLGGILGYVFTVDEAGTATTVSEVHVSGAWAFNRIE
ncbi:MAG: hypothetical protein GWN29_01560 [Gammaproteobacteria bacterium]|nr:hypothetical protein [Gammaproteobacteria bacterium]